MSGSYLRVADTLNPGAGAGSRATSAIIPIALRPAVQANFARFLSQHPRANGPHGLSVVLGDVPIEQRVGQDWTRSGDYETDVEKGPCTVRIYLYLTQLVADVPVLESLIIPDDTPQAKADGSLESSQEADIRFTKELRVYMRQMQQYFAGHIMRFYDALFTDQGDIQPYIAEPLRAWFREHSLSEADIEAYLQHAEFKNRLLSTLMTNLNYYTQDLLRNPAYRTSPGAQLMALSTSNQSLSVDAFLKPHLPYNRHSIEEIIERFELRNTSAGQPHPLISAIAMKLTELGPFYDAYNSTKQALDKLQNETANMVEQSQILAESFAEKRRALTAAVQAAKFDQLLKALPIKSDLVVEFCSASHSMVDINLYDLLEIADQPTRIEAIRTALQDLMLNIAVHQDSNRNEAFAAAIEIQQLAFEKNRALSEQIPLIADLFDRVERLKAEHKPDLALVLQQTVLNLARLYALNVEAEQNQAAKPVAKRRVEYRFLSEYIVARCRELEAEQALTAEDIIVRVEHIVECIPSLMKALSALHAMNLTQAGRLKEKQEELTDLAARAGSVDTLDFAAQVDAFHADCLDILYAELPNLIARGDELAAEVRRLMMLLAHEAINIVEQRAYFARAMAILSQDEQTLELRMKKWYWLELEMIVALPAPHQLAALTELEFDRICSVPVSPEDKDGKRRDLCEQISYLGRENDFSAALVDGVKHTLFERLSLKALWLPELVDWPCLIVQVANDVDTRLVGTPRANADEIFLSSAGIKVTAAEFEARGALYRRLESWCERRPVGNLLNTHIGLLPGFERLQTGMTHQLTVTHVSATALDFEECFEISSAKIASQEYYFQARVIANCQVTGAGIRLLGLKIEGREQELLQYILTAASIKPQRFKAFINQGALKPKLAFDDILTAMAQQPFFTAQAGAAFHSQLQALRSFPNDAARTGFLKSWRRGISHHNITETSFAIELREVLRDLVLIDIPLILMVRALAAVTLQSLEVRSQLVTLFTNRSLLDDHDFLMNIGCLLCNWFLAPLEKQIIEPALAAVLAKLPPEVDKRHRILSTLIEHLQVIAEADEALTAAIKAFAALLPEVNKAGKGDDFLKGLENIIQILFSEEPQGLSDEGSPVIRRSLTEMGSCVSFLSRAARVNHLKDRLSETLNTATEAVRRQRSGSGSVLSNIAAAVGFSPSRRGSNVSVSRGLSGPASPDSAGLIHTPGRQRSAPVSATPPRPPGKGRPLTSPQASLASADAPTAVNARPSVSALAARFESGIARRAPTANTVPSAQKPVGADELDLSDSDLSPQGFSKRAPRIKPGSPQADTNKPAIRVHNTKNGTGAAALAALLSSRSVPKSQSETLATPGTGGEHEMSTDTFSDAGSEGEGNPSVSPQGTTGRSALLSRLTASASDLDPSHQRSLDLFGDGNAARPTEAAR